MKIDIPVFKIRASVFVIGILLIPFLIGLIKDVKNALSKNDVKSRVFIYEWRVK